MGDLDENDDLEGVLVVDDIHVTEPEKVVGGFVSGPPPQHDVVTFWGEEGVSVPRVAQVKKNDGRPRITERSRGMKLPKIPPLAAPKPAPVVVENLRLPSSIVHLAALNATILSTPSPKPATSALAFEEEPTQHDTRPAAKPAPVAAPAESVQAPRRNGWKWAAGLTTFAAAGITAWAVVNHQEAAPSADDFAMEEAELALAPVPVASVDIPVAPAPSLVTRNSAPVYTTVAAAFAGDPQADLKIPTTTNALVHDFYVMDGGPNTWHGVKALHPWANTPEALTRLEDHFAHWGENLGGYEAVVKSGQRKDCHATTIDELLTCVQSDPAIPHAGEVAERVAEMVTTLRDKKIMPDQAAVQEMHEKMNEDVAVTAQEINANPPEAPKPFHYPTAASGAGAEGSLGSLYDAPDPMNVMKQQDDIDLTPYLEQAAAHTGLNGLATWMENAQTDLIKKARGKNRDLLPDFCAGVASEMRTMAERFDDLSPSGKEVALLQLKQNFFARMGELKNGDGQFKSKYLEGLSHGFTAMIAEMLPPAPEGVEGVQGRTRREVLATLPKGTFRPSVA